MIETIVSAGWETTAQKTPAEYPEINVIISYVPFEYSLFGFVKILA
jgi:ubiquitin C-terminal hydrolase